MTIGPLELLVIGYEGANVPDGVGRGLGALEHAGSVRIVDLAVIETEDGRPAVRMVREFTEEELRPFVGALGDLMSLLRPTDIDRAIAAVPPEGRALVALVEHTWATGLRDAVGRSDATMLIDELLPHAAVQLRNAEFAELEAVGE
jgi:hypothetical protein